jgi:aryl-alcohol dehydrogenase-like predicted oxidoreductase
MRRLGDSGLEVSAIELGCIGMSQSYGPPPGDRAVTDAALTPVRGRPMVIATAFQHTMY